MLVNSYVSQVRRHAAAACVSLVALTTDGPLPVNTYRNVSIAIQDIKAHWSEGAEDGFILKNKAGHVLATVLRGAAGPVTVYANGHVSNCRY